MASLFEKVCLWLRLYFTENRGEEIKSSSVLAKMRIQLNDQNQQIIDLTFSATSEVSSAVLC